MRLVVDEDTCLANELPTQTFFTTEGGVRLAAIAGFPHEVFVTALQADKFIQELSAVRKPFLNLCL